MAAPRCVVTGRRRRPRTAVLALVAVLLAACSGTEDGDGDALRGQRIEVLAVWSGNEQEQFRRVAEAFERRTGVSVGYTSAGHGVAAELDTRLAEDRLPDVAFLPQPGLLRRLAGAGRLVPLRGLTEEAVERNYGSVWRTLGSADGRLYGVWFKAANKSLIWYNVGVFERAGVVPPDDMDRLLEVAGTLTASGVPAFSVGGADGWTLTDWFENLYLRAAGPERYDLLAEHRLPWTDESVKDTLRLLSRVLAPAHLSGGTEEALRTSFEASVERTFGTPPLAAMVFEGDFVAGVVRGRTRAQLGVNADVFPFPRVGDSPPSVVGGGDAAVLLRESDAGEAFLRYLAGPEAAAVWAARGGFVSPNRNLDISVYPDEITRSVARRLLDAGDEFRFDLSDLQPAAFGGLPAQGLRPALQDFLRHGDVDATAARLEAEAQAAFGG
ncbi:MAG TPA: ABC transporter substrate-binding protein [Acidimicrobiales bacterium]|nr:ABC transporter substrate-binding protein [Acidimicrobiales bacterium]